MLSSGGKLSFPQKDSRSGWIRGLKARSIKEGSKLNGIKLESCSSLKGFPRCQSRWLSSVSRHSPSLTLASLQAKTQANIFIEAAI